MVIADGSLDLSRLERAQGADAPGIRAETLKSPLAARPHQGYRTNRALRGNERFARRTRDICVMIVSDDGQ